MNIKIFYQDRTTIMAKVLPTRVNEEGLTEIIIAELWLDKNDKFVLYKEFFDSEGSYVCDSQEWEEPQSNIMPDETAEKVRRYLVRNK